MLKNLSYYFIVLLFIFSCKDRDLVLTKPQLPDIELIYPANGEQGIEREVSLSWVPLENACDPNEVTYNVYFGNSEDSMELIAEDVANTEIEIPQRLDVVKQYFWKVEYITPSTDIVSSNTNVFTVRPFNKMIQVNTADIFPSRGYYTVKVFQDKMWLFWNSEDFLQTRVWSTSNGEVWNEEVTNFPATANVVVFQDKLFTYTGTQTYTSMNGKDWELVAENSFYSLSAPYGVSLIVFNGNLIATDFYNSRILYSEDGVNWSEDQAYTLPSSCEYYDTFIHNNRLWLMEKSCNTGQMWNTTDGLQWNDSGDNLTSLNIGWATELFSFQENIWLFHSFIDEYFAYSNNGVNWTRFNIDDVGDYYSPQAVIFKNKVWIIGMLISGGGEYRMDSWYLD